MTAQRLEELRALLADLYWEFSNNQRDIDAVDTIYATKVTLALHQAKHHIAHLRDHARAREAGTR
jgi:hypothetical protein